MGCLSAKVFVGNSISHLLKKSRRSVWCKEYFSSKYKTFITMNREFTEVVHGGNLDHLSISCTYRYSPPRVKPVTLAIYIVRAVSSVQ